MSNRLQSETSPYLKQHSENPVDWQPWDDEAIASARELRKPILLSIGYSACHWCHVMAHESFEDPATAGVMNEHFVNIKVDREERPDLDKVYQLAHQLLTQQTGGWPLTAFLDPETLLPFFAGTYFPKTPRHQLPSFVDLLMRIRETYDRERDALSEQGDRISEILQRLNEETTESGIPGPELIEEAHQKLVLQYDPVEGGFGSAPKFPMPSTVARELKYWAFESRNGQTRDRRTSLDMVMTTLTKMARGGIYDHIGGGFYRYATDKKWMIPHFEKMLYDNGQLLALYADALSIGPDELFRRAACETADWLLREMRHAEGGFYAALDADSEGQEGLFYLWRRDQIKRLLDPIEYLVVETLYGIDKPANFEGRWNLHRYDAWRSVVERLSLDREQADGALQSARAKLLAAREERVRPGLDDKVITSWNGLVIGGLARAGVVLDREDWIRAAQQCADFIRGSLWNGERLMATWKDGEAKYPGYLDDYANLANGLLSLLSADWREVDAAFVRALADAVLEHFHDQDRGGFYFTAHDHETLIYRPKPTVDDAQPPGNGTMAEVFIRLGHLFGETKYLDAAERTLAWAGEQMARYPAGHCSLINALELLQAGPEQILIRGPAAELGAWRQAGNSGYTPWRSVFAIPYENNETLPAYLPRLVSTDLSSRVVAYRCEGLSCSLPIESLDEFRDALSP
jgi:uncharacterized protein YyaL (SSP411 family)